MVALFSMLFMGAATFNAGFMPQINDVRAKQAEYEDAQAAVDYFSKVPDMQSLKERMVQWGAQHGDNDSANNLYDLTDEDLKYLFDRDGNGDPVYQTQTGAAQTLTAEEQNDALDVDGFKDQVTYKDAFGRRYDPSTLTSVGGPRDGNAYIIGGQRYTRVRAMQNNGGTVYQYARIIDDSEPLEDAYNMGSIMDMLVQHGTDLRNDRKQRYLAAGAAATVDTTFLYQERDATYENLYGQATDQDQGGREYTGYRLTHADYVENQSDVFDAELQQRVVVQEKEWDLREQELQDRYEEWERKMDLLLARGRSSWGNAENRFLQEWREWERKLDNDEAEGNRKWDEQIAEHFEKKEQWEQDVRDRSSEENLTAVLTQSVNELNNQIAIANQNMGANMASISTTAYVNEILAGLENDKPSFTEKFQKINNNIKDFKTRLSVSELTGANLGSAITGVDADYREALRLHAKNLKVLANVKVFEEYRKLFDGFAAQLEDQNAIIDQQTQTAAFNAGFVRSGAFFVKSGNISDALGVVNAYSYFDTAGVLREELDKSGFKEMDGGELTTFLAGKDDVEVEAFFHVQKLALQRVYEVLMGRGTQEERRESQDEEIIGRFGTWAGRAPGGANGESQLASNAVQAAKIDLADGGNALTALKYVGFAGFGEQGVMGVRPGGAPLGFYPQLELAGRLTGQGDSKALAQAADPGVAFGPFQNTVLADVGVMAGTFLNQYNVPLMMANSYKNVEIAAQVNGKSRGYMWEAQSLNMIKAPLAAAGGVVTGIGAAMTVATGPLGLLVAAAGMAITGIANSIQVNPTTGERMMKMTDQAAMDTALVTATSFIGGAGAKMVELGRAAQGTVTTMNAIAGATSAAVRAGANYGADGTLQGFNFAGNQGASAALAVGGSLLGSAVGAHLQDQKIGGFAAGLAQDGASTAFGVASEYGKYRAWGADQSGFMGMYNVDGGRLGALGGIGLSTKLNEARAEQDRQATERKIQQARDALRNGQKHEARDIIAGMGYSMNRREEIFGTIDRQETLLAKHGVKSFAELEAKFDSELFMKQTTGQTNAFLKEAALAGYDIRGMAKKVDSYRSALNTSGNTRAIAIAKYGKAYVERQERIAQEQAQAQQKALVEKHGRVMEYRRLSAQIERRPGGHAGRYNRESQRDRGIRILGSEEAYNEYMAARQNGFESPIAAIAEQERYENAYKAGQRAWRGRRNPSYDRNAARRRAELGVLRPGEVSNYDTVFKPNRIEMAQNSTAKWIGVKNALFDYQTTIRKIGWGIATTAQWAVGQADGGWKDTYHRNSAHVNQDIVNHYKPVRELQQLNRFGSNDQALNAALYYGTQSAIDTGRMIGNTAIFVGEAVATWGAGKIATTALRGAAAVSRSVLLARNGGRVGLAYGNPARFGQVRNALRTERLAATLESRLTGASLSGTGRGRLVQETYGDSLAKGWFGDARKMRQGVQGVRSPRQPGQRSVDFMLNKFEDGLEISEALSVRQLQHLAKHTQHEWGMFRFKGKLWLKRGVNHYDEAGNLTKRSIRMFADKSTDVSVHTHFNYGGPSKADFDFFSYARRASGGKLNSLDVIFDGQLYRWSEASARRFKDLGLKSQNAVKILIDDIGGVEVVRNLR